MKSKNYLKYLISEYSERNLSEEDYANSLEHFACMYFKERIKNFFFKIKIR